MQGRPSDEADVQVAFNFFGTWVERALSMIRLPPTAPLPPSPPPHTYTHAHARTRLPSPPAGGGKDELTPDDFRKAFTEMGEEFDDSHIDGIFKDLDVDGNGTIDRLEFLKYFEFDKEHSAKEGLSSA